MKQAIVPLILAASLVWLIFSANPAEGIEKDLLVQAGVLPTSPFYVFDLALESVHTLLTFSEAPKSRVYLDVAEERLAEAKELIAINSSFNIDAVLQNYQSAITNSLKYARLSSDSKLNELLSQRLDVQISVLDNLRSLMPDSNRVTITSVLENAKETSSKFKGNNT